MRGEATPFVMELPVYHVPHVKSLIIQTWQRLKGFFRDDLEVIGKHYPKTDAAKMVQAKPCYVEDRVTADACVIKMLRSPHAHALITHLDVSKAEALPGVVHVITHLNCSLVIPCPMLRAQCLSHRHCIRKHQRVLLLI